MGDFEEKFKGLLGRYATKVGYVNDLNEVISYEQETRYGGYCETCYYDEIVVEVTYKDTAGLVDKFDIYGSMADLIESLTAFEREAE